MALGVSRLYMPATPFGIAVPCRPPSEGRGRGGGLTTPHRALSPSEAVLSANVARPPWSQRGVSIASLIFAASVQSPRTPTV